jgi:hypothetical protein
MQKLTDKVTHSPPVEEKKLLSLQPSLLLTGLPKPEIGSQLRMSISKVVAEA